MKKIWTVCLAALLALMCASAIAEEPEQTLTLRITEVMASNQEYLVLSNDLSPDWMELENYGDEPINLDGLWLSDSKRVLNKFIFAENTVLQPGERMTLYATGVEGVLDGVLCVPFKLSSAGETLSIYRDGVRVDAVKFPELEGDLSYALGEDGVFHLTSTPTFGEKNLITAVEE